MMFRLKSLVGLSFLLTSPVLGAVVEWGQCGGIGYSGETTCASGLACVYVNDYYSQCQKSTASSTSATVTTPSTTTSAAATATVSGFVKTSGTRFTVNGQRIVPVGANSYWVGLAGYSTTDMNKAFADIAATGATVVRTWGFNEVTSASGIYYQSWSGSTPTINTGSTGLANFDNVVALAKANGLRLIVALTNNWADYGGMDVYVKQINGSTNHDYFYTNTAVKNAFKNYVKTFVSRYASEPGIFAWELANEPRCKGSTGTWSGTCTTTTITQWATELSAYIKSLDSNHLVGIGDEGFYNQPGNPSYPYQGGEGIDFDANLKISTVDFGTAHAYPNSWGESADPTTWGVNWIKAHANSSTVANKPVILEEFGVVDNQDSVYTAWYDAVVSSGLTGDLIWQAGSVLSTGSSWDDGYAIYPGESVYTLNTKHAAALKARST